MKESQTLGFERDYAHSSDSIIKIFDNKIEFYNPGRLMPGLTIKKLLKGDYSSNIRNKKIAEIFKEMGLIEKYGSGIKRIVEAFKKHGLKAPIFRDTGYGFMVVAINEKVGEKVGEKVREKVTTNQAKIVGFIKDNKYISAEELSHLVKISSRKIEENIKKLRVSGMLRRVGPAKGGYWEIL